MPRLKRFHHYNSTKFVIEDPVEQLEAKVIQLLLQAKVQDESRDSSVAFELKHSSGVLQFGRMLAWQRGLSPKVATTGALLHDIYVIVEGRYQDHAHRGGPIARRLLEENGGFSEQEISEVEKIVYHHSDKDEVSDDALIEFGKDADVLDSFQYGGAFDYYLETKSLDVFVHYLRRGKAIWSDLALPQHPGFALLDTYQPNDWLTATCPLYGRTSVHDESQVLRPFGLYRDNETSMIALDSVSERSNALVAHADKVLEEMRSDVLPTAPDLLLVWPAIDGWQPIYCRTDRDRLAQLGVPYDFG